MGSVPAGDAVCFGALEGDQLAIHQGDLFGEHQATGERHRRRRGGVADALPARHDGGAGGTTLPGARGDERSRPAERLWFLKAPGSFAAHGQAIPAPLGYDGRVAYEGELAIVIGRRARGSCRSRTAAAHILGYSGRQRRHRASSCLQRDPSFPQWARAKSFDGFGVIGPVIETEVDLASAMRAHPAWTAASARTIRCRDMFFGPARTGEPPVP
jgi:hypothetical protein